MTLPNPEEAKGMWRPIETAPKDGTVFIALVSGLPYAAKYDQHGRFVWYWHADMASGPCYTIHDCDGKRHLEEYTAREAPRYAPSGHLWVNGFAENPTHWLPLPAPPATQEQGG